MEVVTLAKLWGRVEGTPPKPSSLRSWGLRTSALSLYICTTWGGNSSPSEPGGYWGLQPLQQLPGWEAGVFGGSQQEAKANKGQDVEIRGQSCTKG